METKYLTTSEAAKVLRVHPVTVRLWAKEGTLPASRAGAQWRFDEKAIADFLKTASSKAAT